MAIVGFDRPAIMEEVSISGSGSEHSACVFSRSSADATLVNESIAAASFLAGEQFGLIVALDAFSDIIF
jgi:hypothetical protein